MPSRYDGRLEDLLKKYQEGRPEAFEEFFRKSKRTIYSYVRRRVSSAENAQDITQNIYLRIHRYILTFDCEKGSALGWIRSIAQNAVADHVKQLQNRQNMLDGESLRLLQAQEEQNPNDRIFFEEMLIQFQGHLSPEELNLVLERVLEEASFNDIAAKQGIRADYARQKFLRIMKKLRTALK